MGMDISTYTYFMLFYETINILSFESSSRLHEEIMYLSIMMQSNWFFLAHAYLFDIRHPHILIHIDTHKKNLHLCTLPHSDKDLVNTYLELEYRTQTYP